MDDEKEKDKILWFKLIPEFHYDLISRIPPGTFLLLVIMWMVRPILNIFCEFWELDGIAFGSAFLLLLGGGYVVGVILTPLGNFVSLTYTRLIWKAAILSCKEPINWFCGMYQISYPKTFANYRLFEHRVHDYLKTNNEQAMNVLSKMHAEAFLCNNFLPVLILIPIIDVYLNARNGVYHFREDFYFLFPALLMIVIAGFYRTKEFALRQLSFLSYIKAERDREVNKTIQNKNIEPMKEPTKLKKEPKDKDIDEDNNKR